MQQLNEQEFLNLLETHRNEFFQFIYRSAWNKEDAEDIFSEAVMIAWKRRDSFSKGTNFRAWFYRIILNKVFVANRYNMRNNLSENVGEILDEMNEGESAATTFHSGANSGEALEKRTTYQLFDQLDDLLVEAIENLRAPEKQCILLRAMEGYSYREIANIMGIPIGTVMTHLARGRTKLRNFLRGAPEQRRQHLRLLSASNQHTENVEASVV
ncbi:MAG: RNA polymerase sigma factor [Lentisphaerae bacterium]|nr:MAG: RNA polymerase sigma factor [Lentisphaerota bacterium]